MRILMVVTAFFVSLSLLPTILSAEAGLPVPEILYVYDGAGELTDEAEELIVAIGSRVEELCGGAQIVIAVIPSLDGEEDEIYANRLFRDWGIGDKVNNNGILLLLAMQDRRARIEVGYGLEGALPDAKAGRILDTELLPALRAGDTQSGLMTAYRAIVETVMEEYDQDPKQLPDDSSGIFRDVNSGESSYMGTIILVGLAILGILVDVIFNRGRLTIMFLLSRSRGGRGTGRGGRRGGFGGGSSGGGGASRGW